MEQAAKFGSKAATKKLESVPVCPAQTEYLVEWVSQLFGRSGIGFGTIAPLSYSTIAFWSELKRVTLEPYEVEALIVLDAAMRAEESPEPQEAPTRPAPVWPSKKQGA